MKFFILITATLFSINSAFAQCVNPSGERGQIVFNETYDVLQGCTARGWMAFHEPANPCTGTLIEPVIGEVCTDGSIFVGLSPDGNSPMYTTPADLGVYSWTNGSTSYVVTGLEYCTIVTDLACRTGELNSAILVGLGDGPPPAPYASANQCHDLEAHGRDDWYLPSRDELKILFTNRSIIGGFQTTGGLFETLYWSSSEESVGRPWVVSFASDWHLTTNANIPVNVRCVRK